jgi:transposase InsO family protein
VTWLTEISEHPTSEGKLHSCAIKDVWSSRIVGYSINDRMTAELAVSALRSALTSISWYRAASRSAAWWQATASVHPR